MERKNLLGASQVALVVKNQPATPGDARDKGSVPGLGRFPGGGHGNPLQYSCLENPTDKGAWRTTVHRVAKSLTQLKWLSTHTESVETLEDSDILWILCSCAPGDAIGKEPACSAGDIMRCGFHPWVWKNPWRKAWLSTPVFLPGESHRQRSLVGYSPRGHKRVGHD